MPNLPIDQSKDIPQDMPLMGLAALTAMVCSGVRLTDIANRLIERIKHNPRDANALMDLAIISHFWLKHDIGLATQEQAVKITRLYHLPAAGIANMRMLALMHAGDLAANTPLEFLVHGSDIALDMLFVDPAMGLPPCLMDYDLIFIAVGESERSRPLLALLQQQMPGWNLPVLNHPACISRLSRTSVSAMLQPLPGIDMPSSTKVSRDVLARSANNAVSLAEVIAVENYPVIIRPVDSHAGHGLEKIDGPGDIVTYLRARPESEFVASRFVDYRSADGLFRKYRIVLIEGQAYAGHMAISEHWMIHYLNAHMDDSEEKRNEEAAFMQDFDTRFGMQHRQALQAIHRAAGLDYLVIDCAEAPDGRLLIFEIDSAAVIHAMDSVQLFPYKQAQVKKIFAAFHALLERKLEIASE